MKNIFLYSLLVVVFFSCNTKDTTSQETNQEQTTSNDEFNYQAVIDKSEQPVVAYFWATWCGPCKFVSPIMEELATDYQGKATIIKVNLDKNPDFSNKYKVNAVPAVIYFKNGQIVEQHLGALPKQNYVTTINQLISN